MEAREVEVTAGELDGDGRGVGSAHGLEVHVLGALPGERVRACVDHVSPHAPRAWAHIRALEGRASPDRVAAPCPGHGRCGGCVLQCLAYPAQLAWKRRRLASALGGVLPADTAVSEVVPSPRLIGYRNKAQYVLGRGAQGALVCGSYAPGTHQLVDMKGCRVPEPPLAEIAESATRLLEASGLPTYDEGRRTGELRHLILRKSAEGRALVVIVTRTAGPTDVLSGVAAALLAEHAAVAGVVQNVNPSTGGALFGPKDLLLAGAPTLPDRVGSIELELSARSFFQVNRDQAGRLYRAVVEAAGAGPGARLADLFCGVGGISLGLAQSGARVVGIEIHAPAVGDARRSAARAHLEDRAAFLVADAAEGLARAGALLGRLDGVVVNPPRRGLGVAVTAALLAASPPVLVYMSCGPDSLAIDLAALLEGGYRPVSVLPFDLMPGTPHIETVVTLVQGRRTILSPGDGRD